MDRLPTIENKKQREDLLCEAIAALNREKLHHIPGRVFDSAFDTLLNSQKPTVLIVGLNGSSFDKKVTNESSLKKDYENPSIANLYATNWGLSKAGNPFESVLQRRLKQLPRQLQVIMDNQLEEPSAIYTNAYFACTKDRYELCAFLTSPATKYVTKSSQAFFWDFIVRTSRPKLILAYGNSDEFPSAYRMLRDSQGQAYDGTLGDVRTLVYHGNAKAKCFHIKHSLFSAIPSDIPVLAVPHLSRVPFPVGYAKELRRMLTHDSARNDSVQAENNLQRSSEMRSITRRKQVSE